MNLSPENKNGMLLIRALAQDDGCEVLIYGNSIGLRCLARRLIEIADLDQESIAPRHVPQGVGFHGHLEPGTDLCVESDHVIVGRLDGKGTGDFSWLLLPDGASGMKSVQPANYPAIR
jgi:hypothetical protein